MTVTRELKRLDARMAAVSLGIAQARLAAAGERLAEMRTGGSDEVVGVLDFPSLDGKSMSSDSRGLCVEGYAAGFGLDREGEAFEPGAFERGLEKYLRTNPILVYHHHYDQALGVVEDARVDSKGLFIRARLDEPEPGTPLADVYRKVKSGTIKGFSVGGLFKRKQTPSGPRIYTADIVEISVTPLPMEPGSLFAVAGKAASKETPAVQVEKLGELIEAMARAVSKL